MVEAFEEKQNDNFIFNSTQSKIQWICFHVLHGGYSFIIAFLMFRLLVGDSFVFYMPWGFV